MKRDRYKHHQQGPAGHGCSADRPASDSPEIYYDSLASRLDTMASGIDELASRIDGLERRLERLAPNVDDTLRRRGFICKSHSSLDGVVLPASPDETTLDEYYRALKSYHFRRLLSEVIEKKCLSEAICEGLKSKWGREAVRKHFAKLVRWGILAECGCLHDSDDESGSVASPNPGAFTFSYPAVNNFGETLEWFVAQIFQRDFASPSIWQARFRNSHRGGDFDVLVRLEWFLGYVECKCSPPFNVRFDEQKEFLNRVRVLRPDFAVLFIDTTLDIKRNILDNMQHLLGADEKIERLSGEVYGTASFIYIMSSKRDPVRNFSEILKHFMGHRGKGAAGWR